MTAVAKLVSRPVRAEQALFVSWVRRDECERWLVPRGTQPAQRAEGGTSSGRHAQAYTHDCTVLADSSHGDSHVGSVSPAATRTRTLALTLTPTRTRTLTLALTRTRTLALTRTRTRTLALALTLTLAPPPLHRLLRLTTRRLRLHLHHEQLRCRMYRQRSSSAYRCT